MEQEGVIKYSLDFREVAIQVPGKLLNLLNQSRSLLRDYRLIGQDPDRYEGYGFGNLSIRHLQNQKGLSLDKSFYISGSQTGDLELLDHAHIARVIQADCEKNKLTATGLCKPSSESLTHAAIYQTCDSLSVVIHVHSPDIWQHYKALKLPYTESTIPYGTPEMASAVSELTAHLLNTEQVPLFVMLGHQDGVVIAGSDLLDCTRTLLNYLDRARALG